MKFIEKLNALKELAHTKKNVLEYQEINNFFGDMELDEEKMEKIIEYLENNGIDVFQISDDKDDVDDDIILGMEASVISLMGYIIVTGVAFGMNQHTDA